MTERFAALSFSYSISSASNSRGFVSVLSSSKSPINISYFSKMSNLGKPRNTELMIERKVFRIITVYAEWLYGKFRLFQHKFNLMTPKVKLLDQVRAVARTKHLSNRTEDTYHNFIKRYILFHDKRHPKEMGADEISAFLTDLAVKGNVPASTQNQALFALLFTAMFWKLFCCVSKA